MKTNVKKTTRKSSAKKVTTPVIKLVYDKPFEKMSRKELLQITKKMVDVMLNDCLDTLKDCEKNHKKFSGITLLKKPISVGTSDYCKSVMDVYSVMYRRMEYIFENFLLNDTEDIGLFEDLGFEETEK